MPGSPWRDPERALGLLLGQRERPDDDIGKWDWLRNPLAPASEGPDYALLRRSLNLGDEQTYAPGTDFERLTPPDRARLRRMFPEYLEQHNPFIRHIIRRTRQYLEETINPETQEPYLKPVHVRLHGDRPQDAIPMPLFMKEAYHHAEVFCQLYALRSNAGFLKTLLLKRLGSSLEAGKISAHNLLGDSVIVDDEAEEADTRRDPLTAEEQEALQDFLKAIEANQEPDPKYAVIRRHCAPVGSSWVASSSASTMTRSGG